MPNDPMSDAFVLPHMVDPFGQAYRIGHVEQQVPELNAPLATTEKWCQELQARPVALGQAGEPTIVQKSDT
jgi:hypothetical protein